MVGAFMYKSFNLAFFLVSSKLLLRVILDMKGISPEWMVGDGSTLSRGTCRVGFQHNRGVGFGHYLYGCLGVRS